MAASVEAQISLIKLEFSSCLFADSPINLLRSIQPFLEWLFLRQRQSLMVWYLLIQEFVKLEHPIHYRTRLPPASPLNSVEDTSSRDL
ncbi:hypothetical protein Tco_0891909 [Tanacetum coccineum]|uniref:Uncharacterized protein n=1 Tax=Tanacetum coccineum TaxID=301880 RepID=A0ABQ5C7E4_9ASTR